jgi:hypothetical protein
MGVRIVMDLYNEAVKSTWATGNCNWNRHGNKSENNKKNKKYTNAIIGQL